LSGEPNKQLHVFVSPHARQRYEKRVDSGARDVAPEICKVINEGIAAGRKAKRKPRWLAYSGVRPRNTAPEVLRYVWDVHEQICFLIVKRDFKGKPAWYVITTMTRRLVSD
jgi:hypothetical protein